MFSANSSQVSEDRLYVEDVFSTYLYAGTSTADNKITNGIDLAGKGGMVWLKSRTGATSNYLTTNSTTTSSGGGTTWLYSDTTDALLGATGTGLCNFFSDGFDINPTGSGVNGTGNNYASWTFREAPKFFDVVTYTGNGVSGRAISHSLGVAPGCIIVKRLNSAAPWQVYHRSLPTNGANGVYNLYLNTTDAQADNGSFTTAASATEFYVGQYGATNGSGDTYVAYLFAHDTTSDGIIQCGSFTSTNGSASTVNLGWEPQWLLMKISSSSGDDWKIFDNMRGLNAPTQNAALLKPNTSEQEYTGSFPVYATATGFTTGTSLPNATYIYIAIRRGPMRTPTSGTSVFSVVAQTGTGAATTINHGFPVDAWIASDRDNSSNLVSYKQAWFDRILGNANGLRTASTLPWSGGWGDTYFKFDNNTGIPLTGNYSYLNNSGTPHVYWAFRRAPSFFDEVCYTGTGSALTLNHNLGATPEMVIVKSRSNTTNWAVYHSALGTGKWIPLNLTNAALTNASYWSAFTSTSMTLGTDPDVNAASTYTYVAYLFASCPGVSKVGSYTGNGSSQTINCGFAAGARFVMIKRTDSTGDWYVWDSARGIVAGNDPRLSLNSTAAEVTTDDSVDTDSSGFVVNQLSATNINVSSATYIYLAVA